MFVACCSATASLDCKVEVSLETALLVPKQKWVVCPAGYAMTGCNTFAESGRSGGARIEGELLPHLSASMSPPPKKKKKKKKRKEKREKKEKGADRRGTRNSRIQTYILLTASDEKKDQNT